MPTEVYLTAIYSVTFPQWCSSLISLVAIFYGVWLLIRSKHDCPKIFAVFSVAGALTYLVLLTAQLLESVAITLDQSGMSSFYQVTSARSLYDLFMASLNLMVLHALHSAHK